MPRGTSGVDRSERFYKIQDMLRARGVVPLSEFIRVLGVSTATVKRDLEQLRDRFGFAIPWNRERRGYQIDPNSTTRELPGLWFSSAEAHALLTAYSLLEKLQPGLLDPHIGPLKERIRKLLEKDDHAFEEVQRRIRVLPQAARRADPMHFEAIAHALLARKRLRILHRHRERDEETERDISPQRLAHYRDNWYLDAWDHGKDALRSFALDTIRRVATIEGKVRNVPEKTLDAELGRGYGIFAGRKVQWARLRFTPERARWVANELWHPKQKSRWTDGAYILKIPYSDDRELIMDILKYGPDVEVLAPKSLRVKTMERLVQSLYQYNKRESPYHPVSDSGA